MSQLVGIEVDIDHVRKIFESVPNPLHRYHLTILLEMAARNFIEIEQTSKSHSLQEGLEQLSELETEIARRRIK